jgi:hypothetical protein
MQFMRGLGMKAIVMSALVASTLIAPTTPASAAPCPSSLPPQVGSVYQISTVAHLMWLADANISSSNAQWGYQYLLTADINMNGCDWTPPGNETVPFTGNFDGAGFTISNLTVAVVTLAPASGQNNGYAGMFGVLGASHGIRNLNLISEVTISTTSTQTSLYVGGLAGRAGGGTIESVVVQGGASAVINSLSTQRVASGGLVGWVSLDQAVTNSFASSTVTASGADPYAGGLIGVATGGAMSVQNSAAPLTTVQARDQYSSFGSFAGGLVGAWFPTGTGHVLQNSYASGAVTIDGPLNAGLDAVIGGLIGYLSGAATLTNNFASTVLRVTDPQGGAGTTAGGLIGWAGGETITNNYWDSGAAFGVTRSVGNSASDTGIKTAKQMLDSSTFLGWSLSTSYPTTEVWGICQLQSLPYLKVQTPSAPCFTSGPTISGNAVVGSLLTGTGMAPTTGASYRWGDVAGDGSFFAKAGITGTSYTVSSADVGFQLAFRASRTVDGISVNATSDPTSVVVSPAPSPPDAGGGGVPVPSAEPAQIPTPLPEAPQPESQTETILKSQSLPLGYATPKRIKSAGTTIITKRRLISTAGQPIKVTFTFPQKRKAEYKVIRRENGYVAVKVKSKKPMKITVHWNAQPVAGYEPLRISKKFRTR